MPPSSNHEAPNHGLRFRHRFVSVARLRRFTMIPVWTPDVLRDPRLLGFSNPLPTPSISAHRR